jgi:hypothetical protein
MPYDPATDRMLMEILKTYLKRAIAFKTVGCGLEKVPATEVIFSSPGVSTKNREVKNQNETVCGMCPVHS